MGEYNRPKIKLDIYRVDNAFKEKTWEIFRKYHYLNTDLHKGAAQYVGMIGDELVCHTGVIQFPLRKGKKRVHRLVVLPDFQGIGIGSSFINAIGEIVANEGYELNLTTTTPSMIYGLLKSDNWTLARYGREKSGMNGYQRYGEKMKHLKNTVSCNRVTYSFWYKPQKRNQ